MLSISEFFLHFFIRILRYGKIPRHIAFIPDNNRTFAKKTNADLLSIYLKGQRMLYKLLNWCVILKTSSVSIYLLSTHNLKRNDYEKQCVYDAVYVFLLKLSIQPTIFIRCLRIRSNQRPDLWYDYYDKHAYRLIIHGYSSIHTLDPISMNCRIKIIGDVSVLPHELKELCTLLSTDTEDNNGILVNVALNYSGKEEMMNVSYEILRCRRSEFASDDIDENLFNDLIYTKPSSDVDLVIRTTTDKRLSEFLLWQNTRSILYFIDICWPEITEWHLLRAVFHYLHHEDKTEEF